MIGDREFWRNSGLLNDKEKNVKKAYVVAITNQKGGVGKTTTAVNLSACLAKKGQRVLLFDLDPQSNASSSLGSPSSESSLYNLLISDDNPKPDLLQDTDIKGLMVFPSSSDLAGAEVELADVFDRIGRLQRIIDFFQNDFDFIIIDCPPSLGFLTLNALNASDELLIPMQAEYFALEGLARLMKTIERISSSNDFTKKPKIGGIILTMFDTRTNLSRQVSDEVKSHVSDLLYEVKIPRNIRLAEAPSHGMPVITYDPFSQGAKAYFSLTEEFLVRLKNSKKERGE